MVLEKYCDIYYQTSHLFTGLYLDPAGQLKSLANSFEFENGPNTLNIPGEWAPVLILFSKLLGRYFEHQVLAALSQNNCFWFRLNPGKVFSSPCLVVYRSEKSNLHDQY